MPKAQWGGNRKNNVEEGEEARDGPKISARYLGVMELHAERKWNN